MKNKIIFSICIMIGMLMNMQSFATVNVQVNSDGTRYTAVLLNGSTSAKYDIVFVGDGFTSSAADQDKFNNAVLDAMDAMKHKSPYSSNMCAFNIWKVNVISAESGIDHPLTGISKNTELNCTFGNNVSAPSRVIYSTTPANVTEAANFAPAHEAIYVLANDAEYGGAAGSIVYTSLHTSMKEIIVHELGHFTGHLADEYDCYWCDGRAEPPYSGPEPGQVNITIQTNRNLIKWGSFINAATPLPTTVNTPAGVVGLWAGGAYSPTGIFRPQQSCLMKSLNNELCAVCSDALSTILNPYCTLCERNPNLLICMISRLKDKLILYQYPFKFRIPMCCFCPLDVDFRKTEVELSINPEEYDIQVTDGSKNGVRTEVKASEKGGAIISFDEQKNKAYFLTITPKTAMKQAVSMNVKLRRNGQQSQLF